MAWLAVAAGEGQALELFWEDARGCFLRGMPTRKSVHERDPLRSETPGLCERMGIGYEKVTGHARGMNAEWSSTASLGGRPD